jgi:hypothetical protein
MNKRTPITACGLTLLLTASAALAQVQAQAPSKAEAPAQAALTAAPSCDLKQASCVKQAVAKLSQSMAAVGNACGPVAGCGNPPQVGFPVDRLRLSDAQRVEVARAVVLLYERSNLTPKDIEAAMQKLGKSRP